MKSYVPCRVCIKFPSHTDIKCGISIFVKVKCFMRQQKSKFHIHAHETRISAVRMGTHRVCICNGTDTFQTIRTCYLLMCLCRLFQFISFMSVKIHFMNRPGGKIDNRIISHFSCCFFNSNNKKLCAIQLDLG